MAAQRADGGRKKLFIPPVKKRGNRKGLLLEEKLSAQLTDEVESVFTSSAPAGHLPLKGKALG